MPREEVIFKLQDGIEVNNLDEVQAALRNEFNRILKPLLNSINQAVISSKNQEALLKDKNVTVTNFPEVKPAKDISVNNLSELVKELKNLEKAFRETLSIKVEPPQVNVSPPEVRVDAPIVNVPETKVTIPEVDFEPLIKELRLSLNKIRTNDKGRPLAVRLSDGQNFIDKLEAVLEQQKIAFQGFNENVRIRDKNGNIVNPATEETLAEPSSIVSGSATVTTAGTAVQLTATATPCKKVWVNADLGNTNPVVVGDSSVVAAAGSEQGIILIPGNSPETIGIDDLSKLWVDAQTNGDKLAYAYLV